MCTLARLEFKVHITKAAPKSQAKGEPPRRPGANSKFGQRSATEDGKGYQSQPSASAELPQPRHHLRHSCPKCCFPDSDEIPALEFWQSGKVFPCLLPTASAASHNNGSFSASC